MITTPVSTPPSAPLPPTPEQQFETALKEAEALSVAVSQVLPITAKLMDDFVELDLGNGVKKSLSYQDFRTIIGKTVTDVKEDVVTGMLPPSNLIFFSQSANSMHISCYYPSSIRPLKYGASNLTVATPNIIISHVLKKEAGDWLVTSTKYFCTDQPISRLPKTFIADHDPGQRIWINPLSNTYSDARMCYGGNSMPTRFKESNLRGLDYYYKFLWDSPFNDDLGLYGANGSHSVSSWYRLLDKVAKDKGVFPYEHLRGWVKHPDGLTPAMPIA